MIWHNQGNGFYLTDKYRIEKLNKGKKVAWLLFTSDLRLKGKFKTFAEAKKEAEVLKDMKYPEYIYRNVRQALGLEDAQDTSKDEEINEMSKADVLKKFWEWEGILGYSSLMYETVCDIFDFKRG